MNNDGINCEEDIGNNKSTRNIHSAQDGSRELFHEVRNEQLITEIRKLKNQLFGFHCIEHDEKLVTYYTGISQAVLSVITKLDFSV